MITLVGEHDKGTGEPFDASTLSGKRLRRLVSEVGLCCQYANAFDFENDTRVNKCLSFDGDVVALGRVAESELNRQGIDCAYLPHPACRSKQQLDELRRGLWLLSHIKHIETGYLWRVQRLSDEVSGFADSLTDAVSAIEAAYNK